MSLNEITFPKKLTRTGDSLAVIVPDEYVKELDLKFQEMVEVTIKKKI